jgi:ketosteroid isomerase-like protein
VSFIDRINHGDVPGLAGLMTDDHRLVVHDESPVVGKAANTAAWRAMPPRSRSTWSIRTRSLRGLAPLAKPSNPPTAEAAGP